MYHFILGVAFVGYSILFYFVSNYLKRSNQKRNLWSGYRTKRSLKNKESWDYAQKRASFYGYRLALSFLIIAIPFFFIPIDVIVFLCCFLTTTVLFIGIYFYVIERDLKKFQTNKQ